MDRAQFEDMELDAQVKWLNDQLADGKTLIDIEAELGMTQREMGALGLYFVRDKFMGKPMRGYQTAKRSGNEYAATGKGWRDNAEVTDKDSAAHTQLS